MKYKIEMMFRGILTDDAVGQPNEFDSYYEAEAMIPELSRIFECEESEFSIVEM